MNVRSLKVIVVLELAALAAVVAVRANRYVVPDVPLAELDDISANEVREQQVTTVGGGADDWRQLGELYTIYGFFPQAEQCLRYATDLEPDEFANRYRWGIVLERLGRIDEAIAEFEAAISLGTREQMETCWHYIGRNRLRQEDLPRAADAFEKAGSFPLARYERSRLALRQSQAKEADTLLAALTREKPDAQIFYQLRSRAAAMDGDEERAARLRSRADRAPDILPVDHSIHTLLYEADRLGLKARIAECRELRQRGAFESAKDKLASLYEATSRPDSLSLLALVELDLDHPEQTVAHLEKLSQSEPLDSDELVTLGRALARLEQLDPARDAFERAARHPLAESAHRELAQLSSVEKEDQTFHEAMAEQIRGIGLFRENDLRGAEEALETAVALDAARHHAWFYLGETRRLRGQPEAEAAYRRCLALKPTHGRAQRAVETFER